MRFQISEDVNPNVTIKQCSCGKQYPAATSDIYCPVCYPGVEISEGGFFGAGVLDGQIITDLSRCEKDVKALRMLITGYNMLSEPKQVNHMHAMRLEVRLADEESFLRKMRLLAESRGLKNEYAK